MLTFDRFVFVTSAEDDVVEMLDVDWASRLEASTALALVVIEVVVAVDASLLVDVAMVVSAPAAEPASEPALEVEALLLVDTVLVAEELDELPS